MDDVKMKYNNDRLFQAFGSILQGSFSGLSYIQLYDASYELVMHKYGKGLYDSALMAIKTRCVELNASLLEQKGEFLVEAAAQVWMDFARRLSMINDVLMYLENTYVKKAALPGVREAGMGLFLEFTLMDSNVLGKIVDFSLERIERFRDGELPELTAVKTCFVMVKDLGFSTKHKSPEDLFETPFLSATEKYYQQQSLELLQSTVPEYLKWVSARLALENKLDRTVMVGLHQKLQLKVMQEVIVKHAVTLIENETSGLRIMISNKQLEEMKHLYNLLDKAKSEETTRCVRLFGEYIVATGSSVVNVSVVHVSNSQSTNSDAQISPVDVISQLIQLKRTLDEICSASFKNDKAFLKTLKESFERCLNEDSRCAKYLAVFTDEVLCGKMTNTIISALESKTSAVATGVNGGPVDLLLDCSIGLFRFLYDKDVFETSYKQYLARRMLGQRSISQDFEKTMIQKLKIECGHQFTSKLEGMFKDVSLSRDESDQFKVERETQKSSMAAGDGGGDSIPQVEFAVAVLTSGFWPTSVFYNEHQLIHLPRALEEVKSKFETFYLEKHRGRKLSWSYQNGFCDVKALGWFTSAESYEFNLSVFQAIALCMFTNARRLITFREFLNETGVPRGDLKRHLISLATSKFQILIKSGSKKEFDDKDEYTVNTEFASKLKRIKVPLVIMPSAATGMAGAASGALAMDTAAGQLPPDVVELRRHAAEAVIVRIMKSRKSLDHNNLIAECMKHLPFKPTPQDLKKRIESLIDREYLRRDEVDSRTYVYVA